ncbi:MAG: serine hydrolase domain-containing protein [Gemmatimonadales bacterium]
MLAIRLAAAALLVPALASAQAVGPVLDSVFAPWRATGGPGCTVGVDAAGVRTVRAYGMANLEAGLALEPESVLETGSVAKQFTSAAVVLLAQEGRLALDDDIRKYLPEVPDFGRRITIRHLLHHTSGLRDQWALLGLQGFPPGQEVHTFARILDLVAHQQRLNFDPGAEYLYSNTGFALAAIIVQRVSRQSFAEFSRERFFKPLGMLRTEWRDDYRKVVPGRAVAYTRSPSGWLQDMPFTMVHGNGGLLTTVGDLLTWNRALSDSSIPGGAALVRELETTGRLNDGAAIHYALGLSVGAFRGVRTVEHGGATAGYRTQLTRWPDRNLSVAILCNAAQANPAAMADRIAIRLLDLPAEPAPPSPAQPLERELADRLAGSYRDSVVDQTLTFSATPDGGLSVRANGPGARLTYLGNLRFWAPGPGELRFEQVGDHWEVVQFAEAWRRYRPEPPIDRTTVRNADYLGEYRSAELEVTYRLVDDNGQLVLLARPDDRLTLIPAYRDGFLAAGRTVRFIRDRRGNVTGLRIFAGRARDVRFDRLPASR